MGVDLTPEERQKIFLEEKARAEARDRLAAEKKERAAKEKKKKDATHGCLGCLGLVILILVGARFCASELEDPTKQGKGGGEPEFAFTVEEFISRYNHSLQNLENDTRVVKEDEKEWETPDGETLAIMLTSNKNIAVTLKANNVTRRVQWVWLAAGGDGTIRSGDDALMAALAVVLAVENPSTPVSQRSKILRDLGFAGPDSITNETTVVRHGVKYERNWLDSLGMWLTARKLQPHVSGLRPSPPRPQFSPRLADEFHSKIEAQKNRRSQTAPTRPPLRSPQELQETDRQRSPTVADRLGQMYAKNQGLPQDLAKATNRPWPQLPHAAPKVDQRPQLTPEPSQEPAWKSPHEVERALEERGVTTTVPDLPDMRVSSRDVSPPTVLSRIEPVYSEEARKANLEGTVELSAIIRKDGSIEAVRVMRGLGLGLDESAIKALKSWRFRPGTKDGRPVDLRVSIEVKFSLRQTH